MKKKKGKKKKNTTERERSIETDRFTDVSAVVTKMKSIAAF